MRNKILQSEMEFIPLFSNEISTAYYTVFYNEKNPYSHDSNHAFIKIIDKNIDSVIDEVQDMFEKYKIKPRFRSFYLDNEHEKLFPILEKHNYNIEQKDWNLFLLKGTSVIKNDPAFRINRLSKINDKIYSINFEDDGGDWNINRIKMLIEHENYHYLILSKNDEILSVAGLYIGNGFSRVDDVITPAIHRGNGYSQQLMIKLIEYHGRISKNQIFLYADNPIAIHVYKKCGFEIIDNKLPAWEASKKI